MGFEIGNSSQRCGKRVANAFDDSGGAVREQSGGTSNEPQSDWWVTLSGQMTLSGWVTMEP